jgi:hypothetical protein
MSFMYKVHRVRLWQFTKLLMKMITTNVKKNHSSSVWGALDICKLESVLLGHGAAQWSTSISVAAPPLYQLAEGRSKTEMTCWWVGATWVLILYAENGRLKTRARLSLHYSHQIEHHDHHQSDKPNAVASSWYSEPHVLWSLSSDRPSWARSSFMSHIVTEFKPWLLTFISFPI